MCPLILEVAEPRIPHVIYHSQEYFSIAHHLLRLLRPPPSHILISLQKWDRLQSTECPASPPILLTSHPTNLAHIGHLPLRQASTSVTASKHVLTHSCHGSVESDLHLQLRIPMYTVYNYILLLWISVNMSCASAYVYLYCGI